MAVPGAQANNSKAITKQTEQMLNNLATIHDLIFKWNWHKLTLNHWRNGNAFGSRLNLFPLWCSSQNGEQQPDTLADRSDKSDHNQDLKWTSSWSYCNHDAQWKAIDEPARSGHHFVWISQADIKSSVMFIEHRCADSTAPLITQIYSFNPLICIIWPVPWDRIGVRTRAGFWVPRFWFVVAVDPSW